MILPIASAAICARLLEQTKSGNTENVNELLENWNFKNETLEEAIFQCSNYYEEDDEQEEYNFPRINDYLEITRLLISKGAQIHYGALKQSSENGNIIFVKFLLDNGVNVNDEESGGDDALYWATRCYQFEVAKLLIERGANVNAGDSYALRQAVFKEKIEVVEFLLEHGANRIHVPNNFFERLSFHNNYKNL